MVDLLVMAGLDPAIHAFSWLQICEGVDARHIGVRSTPSFWTAMAGHDGFTVGLRIP